jgi:hypothetical protein
MQLSRDKAFLARVGVDEPYELATIISLNTSG